MIGLFLDTTNKGTGDFTRIKKSTELTITLNPKNEEFDYIADESPTSELSQYKPAISGLPLTMYKDEADFKMIWDKFYSLSVGTKSKVKAMIVFMFDGTKDDGFKAWQVGATLVINEMNAVAGTITFDVLLGGTIDKGFATMTDGKPTFTKVEEED